MTTLPLKPQGELRLMGHGFSRIPQPATAPHSDGMSLPAPGRPRCQPRHRARVDLTDAPRGTEQPSSTALGNGAASSAALLQQLLGHRQTPARAGSPDSSCPHRGTGKSEHGSWPGQLGAWGLFLVFTPKQQGAKRGCTPGLSSSQEGEAWCGRLLLWEPEAQLGDLRGPPGASGRARSLAARPGTAWRRVVPRCALSDHPFPFPPAAHLLLLWRLPSNRVVVTKSLYLHKVIVHVIKEKEVLLINVKSIP